MDLYVHLEVNSHIDLRKLLNLYLKRLQHGENKCKVVPVFNPISRNENI
jgi:hypothetical protein